MATNLDVYVNTGTADVPLGDSSAEFVEIDVANDRLIFTAGSTEVADGEVSPSDTQLNSAGELLITPRVEQTIDTYLLDDVGSNILREIHNMGEGNKRYVVACDFDGETASEPVLEVWDDSDMDSIDNVSLGSGVASNSWFRGITTTDALPGAAWTGSRLAGSADGYFLFLNNQSGALSGADTLYFQMKIVIPSTQLDAGTAQNILVIKYSTI